MKKTILHLGFLATTALLLSACGADKEAEFNGAASQSAQLSGTFAQACKTSGSFSVLGILSFTGNNEIGTTNVYTDTSCGTLAYSFTLTGTFTSGGATTVPSGATKLDVAIGAATLTPQSAAGATLLNSNSYCGITNWASGVTQSIIGRTCDGRTYNVGSVVYTIYSFFESALYMGQVTAPGSPGDGSSDANRPTSLGQAFIRH